MSGHPEKQTVMKESPRLPPETFALGRLASLLVLLGAVLYFTGWTYRWSYFGFFQLEVTTLPLPLESFYIAAFQVFFGSIQAFAHTIINNCFNFRGGLLQSLVARRSTLAAVPGGSQEESPETSG